jgi:signal recognition particle subunit SRP54
VHLKLKDVEIEDDAFKHIEAIIHSMTPIEKKQAICNRCEKKKLRKVLELK